MSRSPVRTLEINEFDPTALRRPAPALLLYYLLISVLSTVAFPVVFIPLWLRYQTLRFELDDQGISVSWGMFFKKEVHLTYRRIQDIHVTCNILQRWMGLATVEVQTASGNASAEVKFEGVLQPEALRDFLYRNMRGARQDSAEAAEAPGVAGDDSPAAGDQVLEVLKAIRDEVTRLAAAKRATMPEDTP